MDSHQIRTAMLRIFPLFIHMDGMHGLLLRVRKNRTEPAGRSLRSEETTDFFQAVCVRTIDIHTDCSMSMNINKTWDHAFSSGINHLITSLSLAAAHSGNSSVLQEKIQRLETMVVVHRCIFDQCFHCKTSFHKLCYRYRQCPVSMISQSVPRHCLERPASRKVLPCKAVPSLY